LRAIGATGREALVELRRLLGLLREGDLPAALQPRPGLADLDTLAEQVRAAGLPVTLRITGAMPGLSPGIDLTAFRIVQEALTNTLKHAGPATADVTVHFGPDALDVTVVDTGTAPPTPHGGHGLIGMRERVSLYGGRLDAGPRPDGGYRVSARLPLGGVP
jgi:signal transduction histidine kinase